MNDRLREQLMGYALGALDEDEQREIEQQLSDDPTLRRQLEEVQNALEPLAEAYEEHEPSVGLAARACSYVADEAERLNQMQPGRSAASGGFEVRSRWGVADWFVVSGVCAAAVLLFFPAVLNSRYMSGITFCQNNLRQVGTSLVQYSEFLGNRCFPQIPTNGNQSFAGVYAVKLNDAGLLSDVRCVVCPESDLSEKLAQFRIPTLWEIDAARGPQILILQRFAGGSYAYSLGFILEGRHMPTQNRHRPTYALMADAPLNTWTPAVHGYGRNILYEDQHISFVSDNPNLQLVDDPFCNRLGQLEAGVDADDAVVARSDCPPLRNPAIYFPPE